MSQFDRKYERVPAVGLRLGKTSDAVYRMLQVGELAGICKDGKWFVERSSVDRYLTERKATAIASAK